jgi:hypothetical protein
MLYAFPLEDGGWAEILAAVSEVADLSATALETKAFVRGRAIRNPASLLRLAMVYGVSGLSLRSTAAWASIADVANISDVSLLRRLSNAGDWLELLWQRMLMRRVAPVAMPGLGLAVRLIDGTTISSPRTPTAEWRLHVDYRPFEGRFGNVVLSNHRKQESFSLFDAQPGELVVGDRAYARAGDLKKIHDQGGHFLVRLGWKSVVLLDETGKDFNIIGAMARMKKPQIREFSVQLGDNAKSRRPVCPARLIMVPLPTGAGARAKQRSARKAKRQGRAIQPESLIAAEWMMLLTTVPQANASMDQLVALYRLRWQIELAFKRLKSQMNIDELAAKDPKLAKAWISANLIAVLLADDIDMSADSPPWATR